MKKSAAVAVALAAALAVQPLFGAGAVTPQPLDQRVRETERKQQTIRTQTQRLGEELTSIITEFDNNGMGQGEDVKVLRAIKGVLGNLSDREMARVIELLGSARGADPTQTKAKVAQAFGGQKTIVVELRQLLLEYERQQQLYELSLRFAQLAGRQNGNLKEAKRLVRSANGRSLDRFDEGQKISLSVQKDEQTAIRDEAMGVINRLGALAKDTDSSIAERLNESIKAAQKGRLAESLKNSVEELKAGNLYRAAGSQKTSRDQLRELSRLVAPPKDAQEILRQAAAELERIEIEQRNTIVVTQNLPGDKGKATEELYFDAEDKQGDVVDRTDMVQRDVEHLVPLASEQLKKGEDRMQESRSQILEKKRSDATKNQEQAAAALAAARQLVLDELNKLEKRDEQPTDKLAAAKELKDKVAQLREEQAKLKEETLERKDPKKAAALAGVEAKLQQQARALQPQAAPQSTPAADALADAAKEMGKAQAALEKKEKLDQATAPQQAAVDNLARAEKLLDKEIAELEQAKADLAALEQTREKVAELIKNENRIEVATAQAEAEQKAGKSSAAGKANDPKAEKQPQASKPADAAAKPDASAKQDASAKPNAAASKAEPTDPKAIAGEQSKNAEATSEAAKGLPKAGADAAQPLAAAKGDMEQAHKDLQKGDAAGARPDEKQATANLEKAKDAIDRKIGELQQQLGQPSANQMTANANLEQAIEKAQGEIAQALKEVDAVQPGQEGQKGSQPSKDGQDVAKPAQQGEKMMAKGEGQQKAPGQEKAAGQEKGNDAAAPKAGAPKPAEAFQKTAEDLANAAADASAPAAVDAAIAQATEALAQAAGAAKTGNQPSAQSNAQDAQSALAQAAAALAMAKQGASSNQQANAQQGQGQQKGEGQGQAPSQTEGQGEGQADLGQGQKGQQQAKGQGMGKGQAPSQSNAEGQGESSGDRMSGHAAAADKGDRANNRGKGEFIKLPPRDRNAIMQSRKESAPSEYAPAVEQYLRNLSDSEDK